jgi:hypothetical protein
MFRASLVLALACCFVSAAGAAVILAGYAGCDGTSPCPPGPYTLSTSGPSSLTFDYSIPNRTARQIWYFNAVTVNLEVFDRAAGESRDGAVEGFEIYLIVGGEDHDTATYSLLLTTVGPALLDAYRSGSRLVLNEAVAAAELPAFLGALQGNRGDFGVEVVATTGDFYLGARHGEPDGDPGRWVELDFVSVPEPATCGVVGLGLVALGLAVRKKAAR